MNFRHLGKAGIRISELSFGSWVTYGEQVNDKVAQDCMKAAYESGVNFFDNAEGYADGKAEIVMGNALKALGWRRESYLVSTKIFWGGQNVNDTGLSYKHIIEGTNNALKRLQMEYVDLIYCHRPDPNTPIEETVWAMDQVIRQGKAFYWGTSKWFAADILRADAIARQNNLRPPTMEQPQYNMLYRQRVEKEYLLLYRDLGLGLTIYSPLAYGILTGKYNQGIPEGSRMSIESYDWLRKEITEDRLEIVRNLKTIANELNCTQAQLAIAWCLKNPNVSTVITGASRVEQVRENMQSLGVLPKLTPEVMDKIETILQNKPVIEVD